MSDKLLNSRGGIGGLFGSTSPAPAGSLDTILRPYLVENRVFKNAQIILDGYSFRNCAFIGCEIRTAKGNFHILDCHIADCTIYFLGNALRVVKLSSMLLASWGNFNEGIRPKVEADGGVTIP